MLGEHKMILFQTKAKLNNICKLLFLQFVIIWALILTTADAADSHVWFDEDIHQLNVIEVKFLDDSPITHSVGKLIVTDNSSEYNSFISSFNRSEFINWEPIFSIDTRILKQWRTTAKNNSGNATVDLTQFYYLYLADNTNTADIIKQLRQSSLIEGAYPVSKPVDPPLPPDYESINSDNIDTTYGNMYQRYFDAAPDGIDIHYAREGIGGTGNGIDICDVEYGHLTHSDKGAIVNLKTPEPTFQLGFYQHGTAVLGMLSGKNNGWGTTGLVFDSNFYFSPAVVIDESYNLAAAITVCVNQLNPGDIILIEQQTAGENGNFVPSEWVPSVYAAIHTAVNNGYIVIEAAGNGNEDLDDSFYSTAQPGHTPFESGNDSGAIIIGSSNSPWTTVPRTKRGSSTYGSTVDLHGWGHDIIAPSYGNYYNTDGVLLDYTLFSGTSGASPMVTAAAAILQANYIAKNNTPATPAAIKQFLTSTGTPQESVGGQNIGPQPNLRAAINAVWNITALNAPVITPNSGVFSPPIDVTIGYGSASQNSSNTHIRYTLDGSEPTIDSFIFIPEQGDSIHLLYSANVKATAFKSIVTADRVFASATTSAEFNLVAPQVATPVISPNGGVFTQGINLTITSSTPNSIIRYRTDGRAPSFFYPGTLYNGPISLTPGSYHFTARGYKDGLYKSDVAYADQLTINPITLPTPTVYPATGTYVGQVTVYLGSTVLGATIRYTTDGSEPDITSSIFDNPINIDSTATVKAKIYLDGYSPSNSASSIYTIINQVSTPALSPVGGSTSNDTMQVIMSTATNGASIRYTTNGLDPVDNSDLYTLPLNLPPGQHTIKARAFLSGATFSDIVSGNYSVFDTSITVAPPTITPVGGIFNGPVTITMHSDTEDVSLIFYTTDGTDPQSSGTFQVYNGPFELQASAQTYFIKARAFLSGTGNSNIASATMTIVDPVLGQVATPTMTPESGEYNNSISISVQAPDFLPPNNIRRLYVTRNGDTPFADFSSSGNGSSGIYNFTLSKPETVKALAAQAGWFDSAMTINDYAFKCATPVISTGGTFVDSTTVSISTSTTSSSIYYTTDGSDPTSSDMQYNSSINVTQDQVVKAMCTRNDFTMSDISAEVFIITETIVAPIITTHPQAQLINTCDSTTLSVASTGTSPLNYQWYKNGNVIGGATEIDLELLEVGSANSGEYHVVVYNAAGNASSNTATIIVPIFTSGFESGETANTCNTNNRSSKVNMAKNQNNNNNDNKSNSKYNVNPQSGLHYISANSNVIDTSEKSVGSSNAPNGDQPPQTGVVIIPALNFWMKLILILMIVMVMKIHHKKVYLK